MFSVIISEIFQIISAVKDWMFVICWFIYPLLLFSSVALPCFVFMLFFLCLLSLILSVSFKLPSEWVTDCRLCFRRRARSLFFLLLCCLKSSISSGDGCLRTCCMLPIVSTISNRSTKDKVVVGRLLVRKDSVFRVLSLLGFCQWLALFFYFENTLCL